MSVDRNKVEMQRRPTTSENGPEADLVLTIVTCLSLAKSNAPCVNAGRGYAV
jgi:hypothetical protein